MTKRKKARKPGRIRRLRASAGKAGEPDAMERVGSWYKPMKRPVTLRLDADVLAWFKKGGRGYQTRINRALRGVMTQERRSARE